MLVHIKKIVDDIIADKEQRGIAPASCNHHEIMLRMSLDVVECMRQLYQSGEYTGATNINKVPMLMKKLQEPT